MKELVQNIDFGNEAGDDVPEEELDSYFVNPKKLAPFFDPQYRIRVAVAKKGVGKSALLKYIGIEIRKLSDENLVIQCKGRDLVRSSFPLSSKLSTPNEYINDWIARISWVVVRAIGSRLNIAFSDDAISAVEDAELAGFKARTFISSICERLVKLVPAAERKRLGISNPEELLKRVGCKNVWLIVDDLDATYQRTREEDIELGTFFSALRILSSSVSGIYFRVSLRTDVWTLIRRFDESLDKVEQYVHEITWNQADFRKLLFRRIEAHVKRARLSVPTRPEYVSDEESEEFYINLAFEKRMLWGGIEKRTYKVLYTLSYMRPRWAIQLCKAAQALVVQRNQELITKEHLDAVWGDYGKRRIADLVAEHKHQCKQVEELVSGFRGAERRLTRDELVEWVKKHITNHITPVIENVPTKTPLEIAHFLYRIGFIVARADEDNELYEHYHFNEMPDFLSSRTNKDFGVVWEIHPCYREALDIKKLNQNKRESRR